MWVSYTPARGDPAARGPVPAREADASVRGVDILVLPGRLFPGLRGRAERDAPVRGGGVPGTPRPETPRPDRDSAVRWNPRGPGGTVENGSRTRIDAEEVPSMPEETNTGRAGPARAPRPDEAAGRTSGRPRDPHATDPPPAVGGPRRPTAEPPENHRRGRHPPERRPRRRARRRTSGRIAQAHPRRIPGRIPR
ncbi:hypothetical protein GCM10010405_19550 [Streptomyces macrosporus]|uniref:Uncharacterized protein n=1 Tax=Streptomyces macrosporus TaxID=44032 RepID=A0ABP5WY69_9ACTN